MAREPDPLTREIAVLRRRQAQLVAAAEARTGESGEAWRQAREALERLTAALPPDCSQKVSTALGELQGILENGVAALGIYDDLYRNTEALRRLVATDRRHASAEDQYRDRQAYLHDRLAAGAAILGLGAPRPEAPPRRQRRSSRARPRPPHPAPAKSRSAPGSPPLR